MSRSPPYPHRTKSARDRWILNRFRDVTSVVDLFCLPTQADALRLHLAALIKLVPPLVVYPAPAMKAAGHNRRVCPSLMFVVPILLLLKTHRKMVVWWVFRLWGVDLRRRGYVATRKACSFGRLEEYFPRRKQSFLCPWLWSYDGQKISFSF